MIKIILAVLLLLHIIMAWRAQATVSLSDALNDSQKKINIVLVWVIPFLWSFLIRNIIKSSKPRVMTKAQRGSSKGKNTDNWENLTGYGGTNTVD